MPHLEIVYCFTSLSLSFQKIHYRSYTYIHHISIELNTCVIKNGQIPKLHVCLELLVCEELHTSIMASAILVVIRAQYYTSGFLFLCLKRENTSNLQFGYIVCNIS